MRYHSITAIVAAEITVSFKLRPRLVQLTPRAFHLLSRRKNFSSIPSRCLENTTHQHAQPAQADPSSKASADQDEGRPDELPAESAALEEQDVIVRKVERDRRARDEDKKAELQRAFFIDLMRTVPHPVAVVTARRQDVADDVQGTVAATVSSFNTVSVNPELVVSFNLKSDSTTYKTILDSNYFTITFPQMSAAGANLVHSFTRGNDPSPFTMEFPDHPTPLPFPWLTGGFIPSTLKHHPPAVSLTDIENSRESGFAFAMLYEYQTSTPIGDHVIVTGRLAPRAFIKMADTGWGAMTSNNRIASHHVTLAHVHGTYSNSDTGLGFANLMRLDDQPLTTQKHDVSLNDQIVWCKKRLEILAAAQMLRRGVQPATVLGAKAGKNKMNLVALSAKIEPELLEEYERYYLQRLQYLEYQAQKSPKGDASPISEEMHSQTEEVTDVPYTELLGHQQLFVRNKMLLSMKELDEEIALYSMRLSALRIKAKDDPAGHVLEEGNESAEELAPEESQPNIGLQPEEAGISRNMQLRRYFLGRVHLLQHAKTRKVEFSKPNEKIGLSDDEKAAKNTMTRFLGANKIETLYGLKNKYRRYHYQITEAKLSLIGLEQLPEPDPIVPVLKDRIKYFEPRLQAIEDLIKERAKSASTRDLLVENFKAPAMRTPDDKLEKGSQVKVRHLRLESTEPILGRQLIRPIPTRIFEKEGDSADQLDYDDEFQRQEQTRAAIRRESNKLPIGRAPSDSTVVAPSSPRSRATSPHEGAAEELRQIQEIERDLMRQNANQVRDYLVMQGSENEEMPSPGDFVDVKKIREEKLRENEEEDKNAQSGTAS